MQALELLCDVQAISSLLEMLLQNLSGDIQHVVESVTGGQSSAVAVLWHVTARGSSLLNAKVNISSIRRIICHRLLGCMHLCIAALSSL